VLDGARVLVTGGHGFIGSAVVRHLAAAGAHVVAPARPGTLRSDLPCEAAELDLREAGALDEAARGAALVVHLAARSGGVQFQEGLADDVLDENRALTRAVLRAAAKAGVRRVFLASSGVVYAAGAGETLTEDADTVAPGKGSVSAYAWSKLTDEVAAAWSDVDVVVGRFTNVYGPGGTFDPERSTVVHALAARAVATPPGEPLVVWGDGSAVRSFLHVDDAARAVLAVLRHGEAGAAYNVDSSRATSIRGLAELVRDAVDPALRLVFDADRPSGPSRRVLDASRLGELGFRAEVSLETGVAQVVADYRASRSAATGAGPRSSPDASPAP